MPGLAIKNLPEHLHSRLQARARRHHRSMAKELLAILEQELGDRPPATLPEPMKLKKPLTSLELDAAKREGRE